MNALPCLPDCTGWGLIVCAHASLHGYKLESACIEEGFRERGSGKRVMRGYHTLSLKEERGFMAKRVLLGALVPAVAFATGAFFSDHVMGLRNTAFCLPTSSRSAEKVGEFSGSGFVFKDTVEVIAFQDPKIEGVTVHISNIKRSLTDQLKYGFFEDPSQTSVAASQTGPLRILNPIATGIEGEEVFSAKKNLFFKTTHIRRIYDESNNALVYIAYSTRLTQDPTQQNSRYRTSVSSISLFGQDIDLRKSSGQNHHS
eukprot:c17871_g1_i1 orf=136-906(+)